jgi:diketogulonate reductase-like aldo/keto reductase
MTIQRVELPGGETVPALGLGTWMMGDHRERRATEVAALKLGLDLGMTLVDTAEMYAGGVAEEITGEAIRGRRDSVFVVSKVMPGNASRAGTLTACERSLKRLGIETIDLYLLHWPSRFAIGDTVAAFETLRRDGKIRHWGVSNFDVADMEEMLVAGGEGCAANQVLYNLTRRGIEHDLMPWCAAHKIPIMAYSPIEQGRLAGNKALGRIAAAHGASAAQVALAFVLSRPQVIAIPKASRAEHVRDNRAAADLVLTAEDFAALDAAFPPPRGKSALEMI